MNCFSFTEKDKVLLIGEGNFSFSCSLIKFLEEKGFIDYSNIYATCFEKKEDSFITQVNQEFLTKKGIHIIYGIDATKLESNNDFTNFNFLLFNFPHVGGKMKLNLNRQLLQDFFKSASKPEILAKNGQVLVSLCAGQGGTDAEIIKRQWSDTWQIGEMAAHGNFLLISVLDFPHQLFPSYISTGFRGTFKSFHTAGSFVHIFKKSLPLPIVLNDQHIKDITSDHFINDVLLRLDYKKAVQNNPFNRSNSPQNHILTLLKESATTIANIKVNPTSFYSKCETDLPVLNIHGEKVYLRKSLVFQNQPVSTLNYGLIFLSNSSTSLIANCEALLQSDHIDKILDTFLNLFPVLRNSPSIKKHNEYLVSFNLDQICSIVYNRDIKYFWSNISYDSVTSRLVPCGLHKQIYQFDVSFGAFNSDLNELCSLLRKLPSDIFYSAQLLSVYEPECLPETYFCYRIYYLSYDFPLYRNLVIDYHYKVVCKALELILKVKIH